MPKKLHPDEDIHVFTKIYSPSEVKEPDYTKGKPIEVYNFKKSDIDMENLKANLPKLDSDYNIPNSDDEVFQNYIKQIIALDKAYMNTMMQKNKRKYYKNMIK